jgi:hypothetical protein
MEMISQCSSRMANGEVVKKSYSAAQLYSLQCKIIPYRYVEINYLPNDFVFDPILLIWISSRSGFLSVWNQKVAQVTNQLFKIYTQH